MAGLAYIEMDAAGCFQLLLALETLVAISLEFALVKNHRTSIPVITALQLLWYCWWRGEQWPPYLQVAGFIIGSITLFRLVEQYVARLSPISTSQPAPSLNTSSKQDTTYGPWLLPCKTSHTRQFPKKHGFAYSYLQVAFQAGSPGVHGGSLLRIETRTSCGAPWTWFSVSADDYLFRGPGPDGSLLSKLHAYLKTEEVDPAEVPYVFLVTAPRFLGYSFNPVSFWYLYNDQRSLKYMILEVNNTFGERRMYLLHRPSNPDEPLPSSEPTQDSPFRQTWPKDFHVSPFNSRKGSYSLLASNPQFLLPSHYSSPSQSSPSAPPPTSVPGPQIDNTITLRSSKSHPKLVARLYSTGPAFLASSATTSQKLHFICSWCTTGFLTFPRILAQAAKLFFQHGLHVWFRPEVLRSSLGRDATWRETVVGEHFGRFLQRQCRSLKDEDERKCVPVRYTHALAVPGPRTWYLGIGDAPATSVEEGRARMAVEVQVLSPIFYTQFVVDADCVRRQQRFMDVKEHTIAVAGASESGYAPEGRWVTTHDDETAAFLVNCTLNGWQEDGADVGLSTVPWRWRLLSVLRRYGRNARPPAVYEQAVGKGARRKQESEYDIVFGETKGTSKQSGIFVHPLDHAVYKSFCGTDSSTVAAAEEYRKAVTGLLLAGIFTFGSVELLDAIIWAFDKAILWLAIYLLNQGSVAGEWSAMPILAGVVVLSRLFTR